MHGSHLVQRGGTIKINYQYFLTEGPVGNLVKIAQAGDVENKISQHFFSYKCIGPVQMHEEANFTLP